MRLFKNTFEYGKDWEQEQNNAPQGFAAKQHKELSQGVFYANSPIKKQHISTIIRTVIFLFVLSMMASGFLNNWLEEQFSEEALQQVNINSEEFAEDIQNTIEETVNKRLEESSAQGQAESSQ